MKGENTMSRTLISIGLVLQLAGLVVMFLAYMDMVEEDPRYYEDLKPKQSGWASPLKKKKFKAYDPSKDENKMASGEVESYFS